MIAQYIQVGVKKWNILIYYNVNKYNFTEIKNSLKELNCPDRYIKKAFNTLQYKNTGFTFTNTSSKMSIVCISEATSSDQFISTSIHEIDHVQAHICQYYGVDMQSEEAAYLIGYIARRMYKILRIYV